jgi:DNA-binding Lrp family transcriptional regulator
MRSLELSILDILAEDARTGVSQMATMLGVSQAEVADTVARLEKQRIIIKYPALINWELVETEQVEALIEVRIMPMRDRGFDAVAEHIYRFDEVSSVFLMSGGYDLMVMLKARTLKQLALFVAEKLSTIDGVMSTATHFVLKRYKTEGVVIDEAGEDDRLKVSP